MNNKDWKLSASQREYRYIDRNTGRQFLLAIYYSSCAFKWFLYEILSYNPGAVCLSKGIEDISMEERLAVNKCRCKCMRIINEECNIKR